MGKLGLFACPPGLHRRAFQERLPRPRTFLSSDVRSGFLQEATGPKHPDPIRRAAMLPKKRFRGVGSWFRLIPRGFSFFSGWLLRNTLQTAGSARIFFKETAVTAEDRAEQNPLRKHIQFRRGCQETRRAAKIASPVLDDLCCSEFAYRLRLPGSCPSPVTPIPYPLVW